MCACVQCVHSPLFPLTALGTFTQALTGSGRRFELVGVGDELREFCLSLVFVHPRPGRIGSFDTDFCRAFLTACLSPGHALVCSCLITTPSRLCVAGTLMSRACKRSLARCNALLPTVPEVTCQAQGNGWLS